MYGMLSYLWKAAAFPLIGTPVKHRRELAGWLLAPAALVFLQPLLNGCGSTQLDQLNPPVVTGRVVSGQQAVRGAAVQMYVLTYKSSSQGSPVALSQAVNTDENGNFTIKAYLPCASANELVYVLSRGGVRQGEQSSNGYLSLLTTVGRCGDVSSKGKLTVNEVTTVGSLWPLASFIPKSGELSGIKMPLANVAPALETTSKLVNIQTGVAPGQDVLAEEVTPSLNIYSLANALDACVGQAESQTKACSEMLQTASVRLGRPVDDLLSAATAIAKTPDMDVEVVFNASVAEAMYAPALTCPPSDWHLTIASRPAAPMLTPAAGTYAQGTSIVLSTLDESVLHYTTDGTTPTPASPVYTGPLTLAGNTTVQAFAVRSGASSNVIAAAYQVAPISVSIPQKNVQLSPGQSQQFTASVSGTPNTAVQWSILPAIGSVSSSGLYTAPATLPGVESVVLFAMSAANRSKVAATLITLSPARPAPPVISPETGSYDYGQSITLAGQPGAAIRYTTDGSTPSLSSRLYTGPLTLTASTRLQAIEVLSGSGSTVTAASYQLNPIAVTMVAANTVVNAGSQQQFAANVTGTTNTSVVWSLNPGVGTLTSGGLYTAPQTLTSTSSVTVIATSAADHTKAASVQITVQPVRPTAPKISPVSGSYNKGQIIALAGPVGTTIRYTVDGSAPSLSSTAYSGPFAVSSNTNVQAIAVASGVASAVISANYLVNPVSVSVTPATSQLQTGSLQQLVANVSGAVDTAVTWNLSPVTGTISSSGLYTAPSQISATQVITVTASSAADPSKRASAQITVQPVAPAAPVIAPSAGAYDYGQQVTLSSAPGTAIHYTTDGSLPTSISTLYAGPFALTAGAQVRAVAFASGVASSVTQAVYQIHTVSVMVSPNSVQLQLGASQRFNASVTGAVVSGVTWSMSPVMGTLSSTGIYTAPQNVSSNQVVVITATSMADGVTSASTQMMLIPAPPAPSAATTYYVDNQNGSDGNAGTFATAPIASIAKVNTLALQPGDTVSFKAGDEWHEMLQIQRSGTSAKPITYTAYGTGAKPIVSAADTSTQWTNAAGNVWKIPSPNAPGLPLYQGQAGTPKALADFASNGDFAWDYTAGVLYVYSTYNPGSLVELPARQYALATTAASHIVLQGLEFRGAQKFDVFVHCQATTDCNDWTFTGNTLQASYSNAMYVLLPEANTGSTFNVTNNTFARSGSSGIKFTGGIVGNITGNYFHDLCMSYNPWSGDQENAYCDAIYGFSSSGFSQVGTVVRNNTIQDIGLLQSTAMYGGGIHADTVMGWDIESNHVTHTEAPGLNIEKGQGNIARQNVMVDAGFGLYQSGIMVRAGEATTSWGASGNSVHQTIENNTVAPGSYWGCNLQITQDSGTVTMTSLVFRNNICAIGTSGQSLYADTGANDSSNQLSGNNFGTPYQWFVAFQNQFPGTYAGFDQLWGSSTHSVAGTPVFQDPANGDYSLSTASPVQAIGAAH